MIRRGRVLAGAPVATGCLAAAAAVVVLPRLRADAQALPPGAPVAAVLRTSTGAGPVGSALKVTAAVISAAPPATVQLWAGGAMVDEVRVSGALRVMEHLRFTPSEAGTHLLVLRVVNASGRVAHAAPLRSPSTSAAAPRPTSSTTLGFVVREGRCR